MKDERIRELLNKVLPEQEFKLLLEYLILVVGAEVFNREERMYFELLYTFPIERAREKFNVQLICSSIYFLLFHFRPDNYRPAVEEITSSFCLLKKLLSQSGSATWKKLEALRLETTLIGHVLEHEKLGKVRISAHAWQRFFEREALKTRHPATICEVFRNAFCRAVLCDLPAAIRVIRIIDSGFKGAHYLWSGQAKLRFVVSDECDADGIYSLMTAEKPRVSLKI